MKIMCPAVDCSLEINASMISAIVPLDSLSKYQRFKENIARVVDTSWVYCPNPGCSIPIKTRGDIQAECPHCSFEFCAYSRVSWHNNKSCKQDVEERYSECVRGKKMQLCPFCNRLIEKARNCNHLTCKFCMEKLCIMCRNKFSSDHLNPFNV